jgi:hypothetical protein
MRSGGMYRRVFLPLCALLFVAGGVAMIVAGEWLIGLMSVLFFGGCGLAFALPLLTRRGPGTRRTIDLGGERALLFPLSRAKQAVCAVAAAGMGAAGVLMVIAGAYIGGIAALFFLPVSVLLVLGLGRPAGLALTPTRVVHLGYGRVEIPWEAVGAVFITRMSSARMLAVAATDPGAVHMGRFARFNRKLTPAEITVAADQLAGPAEEAVAEVERWRDDPRARDPE